MNTSNLSIRLATLMIMATLILSSRGWSQVTMELEKGDKAFDNMDFEEALYFFEVANEQQPNDPSITRRIANVYRRTGQLTVSAEWYRKTLELDATNAQDMLYYAEALKNLAQYDEAIIWYEKYATLVPGDKRAQSHLKDKEYYKDLFADTLRYDMKLLAINNADPILNITAFQEETYLISAINATQASTDKSEFLNFLDIYTVTLTPQDELISPVRLPKSVNSKYHDGPAFYSVSNATLYITRTNIRGGKPVLDKKGAANLKIYASTYKDGTWSAAEELKFNSDNYSNGHPCLSRDGQFMYFVSNRDGGYGGTDLYVSQKIGDDWSDPINLGPNVNTEGNEMFPFISDEGYLYFASDGHAGLGGMDIFYSEKFGGIWQVPTNMGAPINSNQDDFAINYDKRSDKGFFCSNRSGRGNDDIFFYTHRKLDKTIIAGRIHTTAPGLSLEGERVRILTTNTGLVTEQRLDENENFYIQADPGDQIEVYMTNAEYFDINSPILSTTVATPITDPYIDLGDFAVDLNKIPSHTGVLSKYDKTQLETSSRMLSEVPLPDNATKKTEQELLDNRGSGDGLQTEDTSALDLKRKEEEARIAAEKLEADYQRAISRGLELSKTKKYQEAISAYEEALSFKPGDTFAKDRIVTLQGLIADEKKKNERIDFNTAVPAIDLTSADLSNILFDYNKSFIRDEDKQRLDQVAGLLKANPGTRILIKAYCDSRGSLTYNQNLSMSRAMAVQGYLVQKGITRDRIQTEWFGEAKPLNGCEDDVPCTEEQYEINRRAELKIVAGN